MGLCQAIPRPPPPNIPRQLWVCRVPPQTYSITHLPIGSQDIIADVRYSIESHVPGTEVIAIYRSTEGGQPDFSRQLAVTVPCSEFSVGNDDSHPLWYTATNPLQDAIQRQNDAIQRASQLQNDASQLQLTALQRIESRLG
jgi:hypothetical protein